MKYLLFAGDTYYPSGGAKDFIGSYESLEEAIKAVPGYDWAHIADSTSMDILWYVP
jgi:hypothetical protein